MVVLGAGGRDFHDFLVTLRDDPEVCVVAFTASQIPGIDDRTFPAALAGPRYPLGIPVRPEGELDAILSTQDVDEVVLAYSDLSYSQVMHKASIVLRHGADFQLLGDRRTALRARRPVVAVCAVRTGAGKSQTSRRVASILAGGGLRPVLVRHPMPYEDLEAMAVQRFSTLEEIDAANPSVEEREEYERAVRAGVTVYAGVDYAAILGRAEAEADVIVWDGGNNDTSFYRADLLITVVDPLRAGDELGYYPGEVNLRAADVVVINKVDSASPEAVATVSADVASANPTATVVQASSPVSLEAGEPLEGRPVLVIEDGPSVTHGGLPFGAATVAARRAGARLVDPRPFAVGSIADVYRTYPTLGPVLPAMGYSVAQLDELAVTIGRCPCDVVVSGSPADLGRLLRIDRPLRQVDYDYADAGSPTLDEVLAPFVERCRAARS